MDAFEAALEAGFDNARLDIAPNGGFSITAFNGENVEHAEAEWTKAINNAP